MRFTWAVLLVVVLSFGCASKPVQEENPFVDKTSEVKAPDQPKEKTTRKVKDTEADKPEVAPANELAGKIVMVNDTLRYAVVDFGFGRLPQAEQRLGVYRGGNKIAEIKISTHSRNSNFAADIITGTVQMGDEVKQ